MMMTEPAEALHRGRPEKRRGRGPAAARRQGRQEGGWDGGANGSWVGGTGRAMGNRQPLSGGLLMLTRPACLASTTKAGHGLRRSLLPRALGQARLRPGAGAAQGPVHVRALLLPPPRPVGDQGAGLPGPDPLPAHLRARRRLHPLVGPPPPHALLGALPRGGPRRGARLLLRLRRPRVPRVGCVRACVRPAGWDGACVGWLSLLTIRWTPLVPLAPVTFAFV
jgi:hypothetical protein